MVAVAAPQREMAWACPECGHGSPEPRDRQAHLDAHRQLRKFIQQWDAAAAADEAAARRRRRRPLVCAVVAIVVLALAAVSLTGIGRHESAPPVRRGPVSEAHLPRFQAPPAAAEAPVPTPDPPPGPSGPATRRATPAPPPSVPASNARGEAPAVRDQASSPAPPPSSGAATSPPAADPSPSVVTVRGCVLAICVNLGG